jgi:hypothetical protein
VLAQIVHVEVAVLLEPALVRLDGERRHEPQAALAIGKDALSSYGPSFAGEKQLPRQTLVRGSPQRGRRRQAGGLLRALRQKTVGNNDHPI